MGWNILIRDSLQDSGQVPSPGYPYTSPDVICTQQQQVQNPTQTFTANYNSDPNQAVISNQNNFIYMRGKNMGQTASGGTVYLYWCPSSMLMTPNQWTQNALQANIGGQWQSYNTFPQVAPNTVTVTQAPFTWAPAPPPAGQHYCTIGAVSTPQNPWTTADIPAFPTWDSFVLWVRNNQNICWRNITLITNPTPPQWDRVDVLNNTFNQDVPILVQALCTNVPIGTTVQLKVTNLGINTTQQINNNQSQTVYSNGATLPSGYQGYVETIATLPSGQSWPTGALITTTVFFGTQVGTEVAQFSHDFGRDEEHPSVLQAKKIAGARSGVGVLVKVGNCSTGYQPIV